MRAIKYPDRDISLDISLNPHDIYRSVNWCPLNNTSDLGEAIKKARKAQNLRQDELAGAAGVGVRFIVDLEAGKPTAQIGKMLHVLQTLGLSLTLTPRGRA